MRNLMTGIVLLFFVAPSFAVTGIIETKVRRLMSDPQLFGQCMAYLTVSPHLNADVSDCKPNWVTFDCSGDFAAKDVANRSYNAAQLALVTNRVVVLTIDNTKKHNGFCWVRRIDSR